VVNATQLSAILTGINSALNLNNAINNIARLNTITTPGGFALNNGSNAVAINGAITSTDTAVSITTGSRATTFGADGSITSGGGNVTLTNTASKELGKINTTGGAGTGNFTITGEGVISQSTDTLKALTIKGTTSIAAGTNSDITLDNQGNDFTGAVSVGSGKAVSITDTNALVLGASTVRGTLGITAAGAVTQTGALIVTGGTTLVAAGTNSDVTLDNAGNNFSGAVLVTSGRDVKLHDAEGLDLGTLVVGRDLNIRTIGALTQSGTLTVTGTTTLAAADYDGGPNDITLANAGNNFGGAVSVASGNDVRLHNTTGLVLGNSAVSGNLHITTGGALTQSGALTVGATTTLAAGATNDITLDNAGNNFGDAVSVTGGRDVQLRDADGLELGTLVVGRNLNVRTGGALTQSGTLTVTVTTTLAAGDNDDYPNDITLDNAGNNFTGAVSVTRGNNVSITNANAL
jgi:hypothetical protein